MLAGYSGHEPDSAAPFIIVFFIFNRYIFIVVALSNCYITLLKIVEAKKCMIYIQTNAIYTHQSKFPFVLRLLHLNYS